MELVLALNSDKFLYDFLSIGVKYFVVGTKYFSCRQALSLDYHQLAKLKEKLGDKELWVLVNALIEESNLDLLEKHLAKLNELKIDGILFQDFAVLQICKEQNYHFKMIYHPDTLNTNQATLNYLGLQGIDGAFLAREIPLNEKQKIAQEANIKTVVKIHVVEYMAYSKRKMLTNYFKEIGHENQISIDDEITIKANGVDYQCHIYEDQYGCHILSKQQMCCLDIMSSMSDFDYLYIESLYVDDLKLVEIVNLYQDAIDSCQKQQFGKVSHDLMAQLKKLTPEVEYYHSFMFDNTVYKIDDVRKREENEKCK